MAEATPWQLAGRKLPNVRRVDVLKRDPYNFNTVSVSQGTNNPVVTLPMTGPHSAGAVPPLMFQSLVEVQVIVNGSNGPEYGVNSHQPA